jgi:hypothetical protein
VFNKQGDTVRSLEYQAREIEAYFKTINKRKEYATFMTLGLNKISTSFGRNWIQGVVFTIAIAIVFFYLLVISSNEYTTGFSVIWNNNFISSFAKFLNPLRFFETESIFKTSIGKNYITLTNTSYLLDFVGRLFIAFGYYQTIQAFRKLGRK